jgi:thiosulfate/3-mercaptopyruvate sulfurtransferase
LTPVPVLVSAGWLSERLADPHIRIVDVRWYLGEPGRGAREYAERHVPGAVYLDIDADLSSPLGSGPGRHPLPSPEAFAAVASRAGIGADTHVIAYDQVGGGYAARLWWLLRYFGHARASLLDGGWAAWQAAGAPTEAGLASPPSATFIPRPQPELVVDAGTVDMLRRKAGVLLLDARAAERYEGRTEPIDARGGHIPGARSAPFAGNLDQELRMLSPEQLRARFDALGAQQADTIVCYCGSGVSAAHNVLALELAGYPGVLLYEGSWSDWSSDPERPIATGPGDQAAAG